jgi:hypothetical protein
VSKAQPSHCFRRHAVVKDLSFRGTIHVTDVSISSQRYMVPCDSLRGANMLFCAAYLAAPDRVLCEHSLIGKQF